MNASISISLKINNKGAICIGIYVAKNNEKSLTVLTAVEARYPIESVLTNAQPLLSPKAV